MIILAILFFLGAHIYVNYFMKFEKKAIKLITIIDIVLLIAIHYTIIVLMAKFGLNNDLFAYMVFLVLALIAGLNFRSKTRNIKLTKESIS